MPKGNTTAKVSPSGSGLPFGIHGAFFLGCVRGVFEDSAFLVAVSVIGRAAMRVREPSVGRVLN